MNFRSRVVSAVLLVTVVTLGFAFLVVSVLVNAEQKQRFDDALVPQARLEARGLEARGNSIEFADLPGPQVNEIGPAPKFVAVYDRDGRLLARSNNWSPEPPPMGSWPSSDRCFDFRSGGEHLRGIALVIPHEPHLTLLFAASRRDLDGDAEFLARGMILVFIVAVVWAGAVTAWLAHRLTRAHRAIASVARAVATGDLSARVGNIAGDKDNTQLAHDVDFMISRLERTFDAQRRFLAHAAHELRTPLALLYGELTHAVGKATKGDEPSPVVEQALASTVALKELADDLLVLARSEARWRAPTEIVSIGEVIRLAVQSSASPLRRDVRVTWNDETTTWPAVVGSKLDLVRMLRNLIENAVEHSPASSAVEVRAAVRGGAIQLSVVDQGPGVPEAERDRIFEPFYRLGSRFDEEDDSGAGLGLSIARAIAHDHDGNITVHPTSPSRGATFVVTLTLATPVPTDEPLRSASPSL
ncbi:MAG TPA: HAMP domain-containing sensor histidine kinase [Polyangiaceae bacterium]|nr:HAMP domain-containing sensor histidine kinase [Polyangiaceae bacterium]